MSDQRATREAHLQGGGTASQDSLAILHDLATLLNTGLNREQLKACVDLIEDGVGPQAVASIVKELGQRADKV